MNRSTFFLALASLLVTIAAMGIVHVLAHEREDSIIEAQIAGCERGNDLRAVVFANTKAAVRENRGNPNAAFYRANLATLIAPAEVDDRTGLVDCQAVIR